MGLLETIKRVALAAVESSNPVNVLYGTVEKAAPLEIRIHEKLKLTEDFLDVAQHLTQHERFVSTQNESNVKLVFENGLKKDEKVVLLRIQGGHRFYVIDR